MNTEKGRRVKSLVWDYDLEQDFLEATFLPGKLSDEEIGDLRLLSDMLVTRALTLNEEYLDELENHEVRLQNFELKLERGLKFHQRTMLVLWGLLTTVHILVCYYCASLKVTLIVLTPVYLSLWAIVSLIIRKAIRRREDILFADDEARIKAYNENCIKEKRSLDMIKERPPEVRRWLKNADVIDVFVSKVLETEKS